jgi:hypothetical protein
MNTRNGIAALAAAMGTLVLASPAPAHAASKKIWFCRAVCVAVDSRNQLVELAGRKPPEGYGNYRLEAYQQMADLCSASADRLGMPEAVLASRFSYRTESDRSGSKSWSVYARDAEYEAASGSYDQEDEAQSQQNFWHYDTRSYGRRRGSQSSARGAVHERYNGGSESFSSHDGLELSVDPAMITDPAVCHPVIVDASWLPEYQTLPGDGRPQG